MIPHVAAYPGKQILSVKRAGVKGLTYDFRAPRGSPSNTAGVVASGEVGELLPLLHREWRRETYFASYVLSRSGVDLVRQPRVSKTEGGYEWVLAEGYEVRCEVVIVEVDNPLPVGHTGTKCRTTAEHLAAYREKLSGLPIGWYETPNGIRIVQVLSRAVEPSELEGCINTLGCQLADRGVEIDWGCLDWTRLQGTPYGRVVGGEPLIPRVMSFDAMVPVKPDPTQVVRRSALRNSPRSTEPIEFASKIPEGLPVIPREAMHAHAGSRHVIMLAVSGSLLGHGAKPERVPEMVYQMALAAGIEDRHALDDRRGAEDTVRKWAAGYSISNHRALLDLAPDVAAAIERYFAGQAETRARELNSLPEPERHAPAEAYRRVVSAIRTAPPGPSVVQAQCGIGKSRAAREVAATRAAKQSKRKPGAVSGRKPLGSATAISVPTHKLVEQYVSELRAQGVPTRKVFGVLSVVGDDGRPVCRFAASAAELARGHQSIPKLLCSKCEWAESCEAFGGSEGPEDARVAVGPHQLLSQLDAFAGTTGILVIDEPPDLLETETFTAADLALAWDALGYFSRDYAAAMAPALWCVLRWVQDTTDLGRHEHGFASAMTLAPPQTWAQRALEATGQDDPRECARCAFPDDHEPRHGFAPPILKSHVVAARTVPALAKRLGDASRVLYAVWRALQPTERVSTRVELRGAPSEGESAERVLLVTAMRVELASALMGDERPCVVLDANADLHLPILRRLHAVRYQGGITPDIDSKDPPFRVTRVYATEAPTERTLQFTTSANRKVWLPREATPGSGRSLLWAVRTAVEWWSASGGNTCWMTFLPVELALRAALGLPFAGADPVVRWRALGRSPDALGSLVEGLRPILAPVAGSIDVAHYGALRGLDHWKDAGSTVTLGDPIPNLGEVQHEVAFLHLDARGHGGAWEGRAEARARAELEQAHGRLRTVHRSTPARQLHVGKVLPGGWHGAEIRSRGVMVQKVDAGFLGGRPANDAAMGVEEAQVCVMAAGGRRQACERTGISAASLSRYLGGKVAIPEAAARRLRALLAGDAANDSGGERDAG